MLSTRGLLAQPRCHERKPETLGTQQALEPRLIERHLLMRRVPEGPDFLLFAPGRKGVLLDCERQQRFEMLGFRVTKASLPSLIALRETRSLSAKPACVSPMVMRRVSMA